MVEFVNGFSDFAIKHDAFIRTHGLFNGKSPSTRFQKQQLEEITNGIFQTALGGALQLFEKPDNFALGNFTSADDGKTLLLQQAADRLNHAACVGVNQNVTVALQVSSLFYAYIDVINLEHSNYVGIEEFNKHCSDGVDPDLANELACLSQMKHTIVQWLGENAPQKAVPGKSLLQK